MKEKPSSIGNLYDKIQDESSMLGRLADKIPGFSGYIERSRRRAADQLLREAVSARIDAVRLQIGTVQQALSRDILKAIDHAEPLGNVDTRLMGLAGKIKDAPVGYAGFFDAVKIKEDSLANIYSFDESMLAYTESLADEVGALEQAVQTDGDIAGAIRALNQTSNQANHTWNSRQQLLAGVNE